MASSTRRSCSMRQLWHFLQIDLPQLANTALSSVGLDAISWNVLQQAYASSLLVTSIPTDSTRVIELGCVSKSIAVDLCSAILIPAQPHSHVMEYHQRLAPSASFFTV
ncbi:hypothetical protein O6H91_21G040000 [Diphasiastrum complanatum]|uniref:Uncharacterized protein n=1 Tax=Diphasiastrum complanatum TaxID=34168 RepID=A0ACC2AKY6_DIPCM|nr:hypothetical protein O6H91_21G040000 [Diphasiastrum complanatum]